MFNFQPLINNLAQLAINLALIVTVTARAYYAQTVANETLIFFPPFNDFTKLGVFGQLRASSMLLSKTLSFSYLALRFA